MSRITTFKEWAKSHDAVTTYAAATEALGGETSPTADCLYTKFYRMKNYDGVVGIGMIKTVTSDTVITFRMYQATDTDGGGSATIAGVSTTYTSTQATDVFMVSLQVNAEDVTDGYDYIGMRASTSDASGSEACALVVIPINGRYGQATMPA